MIKSKDYFTNVPNYGNLDIEQILYEDFYPVLFVLHSQINPHLKFICSCCDIRNEQRWLLAPVTINNLVNFLNNEISVHDIFLTSCKNGYIVRWHTGDTNYNYTVVENNSFPEDDLPRQGFYLEAEDDDTDLIQYQKDLQNEVNNIMNNIEVKRTRRSQFSGVLYPAYSFTNAYAPIKRYSSKVKPKVRKKVRRTACVGKRYVRARKNNVRTYPYIARTYRTLNNNYMLTEKQRSTSSLKSKVVKKDN